MTRKLEGRTAVITGGSRGIGASIALAYAAEGADIAICHLDDAENADKVVASAHKFGVSAYTEECDVSDPERIEAFVSSVEKELGAIDIFVSNAGISGETPFADITLAKFDKMLDVHLRALFIFSQRVLPAMRSRGYGRIIAISSQLAYKGAPGLVHYCSAKAGITGFVRSLAQEVAREGVLVNAIAPGPVDTRLSEGLSQEWVDWKCNQLPLGRFGSAAEIAPTAVLLASEDGSFYVGQTLSPNGGDIMI